MKRCVLFLPIILALSCYAQVDDATRQLSHDIFKQLIETNTTDSIGNVTTAAEAMAQLPQKAHRHAWNQCIDLARVEVQEACLDRATAKAIEALKPGGIGEERACGRMPIRGLLQAARRHGLRARTVDLRNSGDTAGPRDRVVGYGAFVFEEVR